MTGSQRPLNGGHGGQRELIGETLDERLDVALAEICATEDMKVPSNFLTQQKEILMSMIQDPAVTTVTAKPMAARSLRGRSPRSGRSRFALAGGTVALGASLLVAGPAAAGQIMTWLGRAPVTSQEADQMRVIYHGQSLTVAQLEQLERQGNATITVQDPVSNVKGEMHAFDTRAEADAWTCAHVAGLGTRPVCAGTPPTMTPEPASSR